MSGFAQAKIKRVLAHPADFSWSPEEYSSLVERMKEEAQAAEEESRRQAHARAWELARQQGVGPIRSIKDLQGDFWPEEESADEFLSWLRATRQADKPRNIPE